MSKEKDSSDSNGSFVVETSETRLSQVDSGKNIENPDEKIGFSGNVLDFLGESERDRDGFQSKPSRPGNSGSPDRTRPDSGLNLDFLRESVVDRNGFKSKPGNSGGCQELTFSYLCENPKLDYPEKSLAGSLKGKGVALENIKHEEKWVERDFLQLNDSKRDGSSKRGCEEETKREVDCSSKKPKLETLKLSLALPDVSLSLTASNAAPNCDAAVQFKPSRSVQYLALSNNNTQTTCSNDFMTASLSYSYSHPFSHNPSCSLTRNSTENFEKEADQIWNCGEGTNGSVHSRFKPIGDGPGFSNHGSGVVYSILNRGRPFNRDSSNSLYRTAGSDSSSFFPSELPARPKVETMYSVESMRRSLDHLRGFDNLEDKAAHKHSRGEMIVRDVITEPISVMSQAFQEFPSETIESAKEYVKSLMAVPERKDELVGLQSSLEQRPDLTKETLSKSHKVQLEILVAVKFGLDEYVLGKVWLQTSELVEIFLFNRCRNVNCRSFLPVDDCDCKICSTKKGFCSQCMCPVCYNYDCASNTCSWVGCDTCSHWCHAACGIEKNLIRPGPSLKGANGTAEMQFYCLGCGRPSEMFGFVKDVFIYCAKDWGLETLLKELDCVRRIFKRSEDLKGKELYLKAAELITRLERGVMSPSDACNIIILFFTNKEGASDSQAAGIAGKDPTVSQGGFVYDTACLLSSNMPPKSSTFSMNSARSPQDLLPYDLHNCTPNSYLSSNRHLEDRFSVKSCKEDGLDSLESIVRIKEAEARMFQDRADEARKEVEAYRHLVRAKTDMLEQEYAEKLAQLSLQETEERRKKKLEELKTIENSHANYFKMKMRMQAEISGLLEKIEATRLQWV